MKTLNGIIAVLLVLISGLAIAQSASAKSKGCDRACLNETVDSYLAALVAHDPSRVATAANAKFVENTVPMKPGEGFWKTASAVPTTFAIYVPDPTAQQVGFLGVMKEGDKPVLVGLRLKLVKGKITEAELLVVHTLGERNLPNLQAPRPGLLEWVPVTDRVPREQMLKIGASYYDALVNSDGKAAPFADDCVRRENGMQTTSNPPPTTPGRGPMATMGSMGCTAQLDTHVMSYIKRIEPRRVWIADVENGLVFGLSQFRHPMVEKSVKIVGVPGVEEMPMNFNAFDLPAAHIYKIRDGKIHEIEAMGFTMPYNSKTGWE